MSKSSNKKIIKNKKPLPNKSLIIEKTKSQEANSINYLERFIIFQEKYTKFVIDYNGDLFEDNIESYKRLLNCSNFEDVMNFQEKFINHNVKRYFNKTIHSSNEMIEFANEVYDLVLENYRH